MALDLEPETIEYGSLAVASFKLGSERARRAGLSDARQLGCVEAYCL